MKRYESAVSNWLVLVLLLALGLPLSAALYQKEWLVGSILLLTSAFIIHLFLNTYYLIKGNELWVKAGLLYTIKIKIQDIKRIEKSSSLLASPALSLDRMEIFYGKWDSVLISPKNRKEFIQNLLLINNALEIQSDLAYEWAH